MGPNFSTCSGLGWVVLGQSVDGLGWIGSHKMDTWTTLVCFQKCRQGWPLQSVDVKRCFSMTVCRSAVKTWWTFSPIPCSAYCPSTCTTSSSTCSSGTGCSSYLQPAFSGAQSSFIRWKIKTCRTQTLRFLNNANKCPRSINERRFMLKYCDTVTVHDISR